jgi:hypothetical protein
MPSAGLQLKVPQLLNDRQGAASQKGNQPASLL